MSITALLGCGLSACSDNHEGNADMAKAHDLAAPPDVAAGTPKAVYTMSNDATDNRIYVYTRAADGSLTAFANYSTGGKGAGGALGSQNSLIFDAAQNLFFAANAGDNTVSVMSLQKDGTLALITLAPSGGIKPVSVTEYQGVVYTLNAGNTFVAPNIAGLQLAQNTLNSISASNKALSTKTAVPAQIQFNANGTQLVVTEKSTNVIDTFPVAGGVASSGTTQASKGMTPYGFAFSANGQLIVSEATQGAVSSYTLASTGTLTSVSSSVSSGQSAPCWVTVARDVAYVTNAMSNNVSAYRIATDGTLTLLASGVAGTTGNGPTDEDATDDNGFLYVLNSKDHSLSTFQINADGTLVKKSDFAGLPTTAVGLVAR
jgi:6-phosphogluconolactonase (cycloisomerase 2 family)